MLDAQHLRNMTLCGALFYCLGCLGLFLCIWNFFHWHWNFRSFYFLSSYLPLVLNWYFDTVSKTYGTYQIPSISVRLCYGLWVVLACKALQFVVYTTA